MYSYIKGTVEEINLDYVVIDNNNIGYKINVSSNTIKDLHLGSMAKIYTKLIVFLSSIILGHKHKINRNYGDITISLFNKYYKKILYHNEITQ